MRISVALIVAVLTIGCVNDRPTPAQQTPTATSLTVYETSNMDTIYIIDGATAPWGGYGRLLVQGMSWHLGRKGGADGPIQLERTGPFVPPITFPGIGDIIVTDEMKELMERAGFRGVRFRPVEKTRIVDVPWHEWDLAADEPDYYPDRGEPEGYILDAPHSKKLAASLGAIWEVVLSDSAKMIRHEQRDSINVKFEYVKGSWKGNDLFSVPQTRYRYASARAKAWFENNAGNWVSFRDGTRH